MPLATSRAMSLHPWPKYFHHLPVRALMVQGRQPSELERGVRSPGSSAAVTPLGPSPRWALHPAPRPHSSPVRQVDRAAVPIKGEKREAGGEPTRNKGGVQTPWAPQGRLEVLPGKGGQH